MKNPDASGAGGNSRRPFLQTAVTGAVVAPFALASAQAQPMGAARFPNFARGEGGRGRATGTPAERPSPAGARINFLFRTSS